MELTVTDVTVLFCAIRIFIFISLPLLQLGIRWNFG